MKKSKRLLCALISGLMLVFAALTPVSAADNTRTERFKGEYTEGEAVVVLKGKASSLYSVKSKASQTYGGGITLEKSFEIAPGAGDGVKMAYVKSKKLSTEQLVKSLKKKSGVKYAFPNYKKKISALTNDTYSKYQWALENTGQQGGTAGDDINAEALWDKAAQAEKELVVAVIDTGIDFNHEDLKDIIWTNPYGSKLLGKNGYDFTYSTGNGKPQDDNGHGTHVSGIIAAAGGNEKGISGVNKSNVKILPLKCFDSLGGGSSFSEFSAFDYIARAVKLGANIKAVNCSYCGVSDEEEKKAYEEIFDELGASGIITVTAAGNESEDLGALDPDWYDSDEYILPAANDSKYCITVAASDENDRLAYFSNYSEKYTDIAAPGNDILSSVCSDCFNPSIYTDAQINNLAKSFQNYNGSVGDGDFGYPVVVNTTAKEYQMSDNAQVSLTDTHFGTEGKSLSVKFNEGFEEDGEEGPVYLIEIPFTLEDENKPYRISFMGSTNEDMLNGYVIDVPADYGNYLDSKYYINEFELYPNAGTWDHFEYLADPCAGKNYKKSVNRKLQFYVFPAKGGALYIDDLAVSKQGVNENEFGKYDFMSGTSMAAPYVTGAVALVSNCCPGAHAVDIKNMVCGTGRVSEALKGKVKGGRSLSLGNTDKVPPVITSVKYSSNGKDIEIIGSMNDASAVKVNGEEVTPISTSADMIVIRDNKYNTKKVNVELTNACGTCLYDTFLSNKPKFPASKKVIGAPELTYELIPVAAGSSAYFVNIVSGNVEKLCYKIASDRYVYQSAGMINLTGLSKEKSAYSVTSAVYKNGKIYFTASNPVYSSYYTTIGYDSVYGCYDVSKGKTKVICEIPNVPVNGATLAEYKGGFYIIGGYDNDEHTFLDTVYKYNPSLKAFEEFEAKLPEGRAYTDFAVYGGKLVGVYGGIESGYMPPVVTFDGTAWTNSSVVLDSEDRTLFDKTAEGKECYIYEGCVGLGENGVFCNGSYIYGTGDTFTYNPSSDTVTASKYSMTNSLTDQKVFGATIAGCFIGFTADKYNPYDDDDDDDYLYSLSRTVSKGYSYDDNDEEEIEKTAYLLPLKNTKSDPAKQTYIQLKKSSASMYVKGTYKISAAIRNPKGKTTFTSGNSKVAKVSSKGVVTALKKGIAAITVKNNGVKRTFRFTVKNPSLNASSKTLRKGRSFTIRITGKIGKAEFVSSNKSVAQVNSSGKVTAKSNGTAIITVTTNGIKLRCIIKVK